MTAQLAPQPVFQAFAPNGGFLVGGKLFTYIAGTTTPQATYIDATLTTQNTNPVILNAMGQAPVWLNPLLAYKFILTDSVGNVYWTADSINSTANLNFTFTGGANDVANAQFTRNAAYSGSIAGFVNSAMRVTDNVTSTGLAYEWTFVSIMNNSSTTGQQVAGYSQGNRSTNTAGATWAAVAEAREVVPINNPTTGLVGLEVDNRSNGTDSNGNRIGIDVVCTRYNTGGVATNITFGVRVQSGGDGANSIIANAFSAYQCNVAIAFDCANATVGSGALRMAQNVPILFDVNGVNQFSYDTIGLTYKVSGVAQTRLLPTGGLGVFSAGTVTKVVGSQIPGWGASSNGARGAINGSTATLAQTSAALAQLIIDLQTHGLLGG